MDLLVVKLEEQRRPALQAKTVNQLVKESEGEEQALYVLLGATGMRVSEALAVEAKHFINDGRTIQVRQQVLKDKPRLSAHLKTGAAKRDVDLSTEVAEYFRAYIDGKKGLLFKTRNGTPRLHSTLEGRWLTPRLIALGVDEPGMGFHAFRRFRKTWLRGKRCQEDINNYWTGHSPVIMSELYSRLKDDLEARLEEAELVGVGFKIPVQKLELNLVEPRFEAELAVSA